MEKIRTNGPDFIIIGAMKCATSTLHDQLSMHNSFFMTTPKEPNFFSNDEIYANGFQWYESLFEGATSDQLRGESSTHYTKLPQYIETVSRVSSYCPAVKTIYIMRHPIDRLVSHYIHEWTQGIISCDINKAVHSFPELIEYGKYNMQIEPYLNSFGHSSVLPVFSERLRDNPLREMQKVFDFLDVSETPVWDTNIRSNVSAKRLRVNPWRDMIVNNKISQYLRRRFVPKKFRRIIRSFWTMQERPELSQDTLERLESIFNEDLKLLGQKLGLNLNCTNYKELILPQKEINWSE